MRHVETNGTPRALVSNNRVFLEKGEKNRPAPKGEQKTDLAMPGEKTLNSIIRPLTPVPSPKGGRGNERQKTSCKEINEKGRVRPLSILAWKLAP